MITDAWKVTLALEEIVPLKLRQLGKDVLSTFEIRNRYSQTLWISSCCDLNVPARPLAWLMSTMIDFLQKQRIFVGRWMLKRMQCIRICSVVELVPEFLEKLDPIALVQI